MSHSVRGEMPFAGHPNVGTAFVLARLRTETDLSLSKAIMQGFETGRPSLLQAQAEKQNGVVTATYICGRCVPVMTGSIDLVG